MDKQIMVSDDMLGSLKATHPWVKFLAILGFIFAVLSLLFGVACITGVYTGFSKAGVPPYMGALFGIVYILLALVFYVFPSLYLYRYAKAIAGIEAGADDAFDDALMHQKTFWRYIGVLTLIFLIIYALFIVVMIFAVIFGATHYHGH
jgi:hypothetical protein